MVPEDRVLGIHENLCCDTLRPLTVSLGVVLPGKVSRLQQMEEVSSDDNVRILRSKDAYRNIQHGNHELAEG